MHRVRSRVATLLALSLSLALAACTRPPPLAPAPAVGTPEAIAPGVDLYRNDDPALVDGAGPIAAYLLRLDPARIRLESVLSNDEIVGAETVDRIAQRNHALVAINGGYFNRENGEPTGLLKVAGQLVSDASRERGVVIIKSPPLSRTSLLFDQLSVKVTLAFRAGDRDWRLPIDGVDTTRGRGKLMLYTPAYHADTDTAPTGTEWVLDGHPLHVVEVRRLAGHTAIPRDGAVLSFGGEASASEALTALTVGASLTLETAWRSSRGIPVASLEAADDIVNGAGLLRHEGETLTNWDSENLRADTFTDARHPRTLIGVDAHGFIWLAAIDGRQPDHSIGMTFADLQRLCDRLELRDALNLDGGGSTTMVIRGRIVNTPSDPMGPRPVSDAILVTEREGP